MTAVTTTPTKVMHSDGTENCVVSFANLLDVTHRGTVASATSTTIVLDAGASGIDDDYNDLEIVITSGTGAMQTRTITDYDGGTKTATIAAWDTTPDSTSTFAVQEVLSGTPTVTESTGALTLSNKAINTRQLEVDGIPTPPKTAVQFRTTGGSSGTTYSIKVSCGTDRSATKVRVVKIQVTDT